jgi:predicted metal-dependent enzyme (double-stranded beta helix superfamily)
MTASMLKQVLAACRAQVREEGLLDAFEAREAGSLERAYLQLGSAAIGCEAWLIRWPVGSVAPLHDHGMAYGVAQVVTGALFEQRFTPLVRVARERDWQPGAEVELAKGIYHEVRNLGLRTAYSIHVYAPRLEQMTFYARGARGELRALRQEQSVEWQPAPTVLP